MKLVALLLSLCFSFNILAASGTAQELEKALDNYNYSLAVEWDQKNVSFQEAKTQELISSIVALRNSGLSREEMMSVIEKKVANKEAFEALKLKVSMMNITSAQDLSKAMRDISKDMYAKGASWNGNGSLWVLPAVIIIVAILVLASNSSDYECTEWEVGEYCEAGDYMVCGYGEHCVQYQPRN